MINDGYILVRTGFEWDYNGEYVDSIGIIMGYYTVVVVAISYCNHLLFMGLYIPSIGFCSYLYLVVRATTVMKTSLRQRWNYRKMKHDGNYRMDYLVGFSNIHLFVNFFVEMTSKYWG